MMRTDLTLVPIDELIDEISNRHPNCVILATRILEGGQEYIFHDIKLEEPLKGLRLMKYGRKLILKNFI